MNQIPSNRVSIIHIRPKKTKTKPRSVIPQTIAYATSLQSVRDVLVVRLEMGFAILNDMDIFRKDVGVKIATSNLQNQILPRYASVILGYATEVSTTEEDYVNKYGQIPILSNANGSPLNEGDWVTVSRHFDITSFIRNYAFDAYCSRQLAKTTKWLGDEQVTWTPA